MPRILVVDDEPSALDFTSDFFSPRGYEVIEAATGKEGRRRLREDRPHLMLLDIILPDIDGLEVLSQAKAIDPAVGVIMLTGVLDETIGDLALQAGAFDYVTKPVDLKHLDRVVWYQLTNMTIG